MVRRFVTYKTSNIFENRCFGIDQEIANDFLELLENDKKLQGKVDYIINRILNQRFMYFDNYVKLGDNISEMRIFPNGINARIYCKEIKTVNGSFYIIAAKFLPKKSSQKITKELLQFIEPIKSYEYEEV